MLSPTMMTNSYGKTARDAASRAATSYCAFSPVPVSPITANLTESCATGASVAPADGAPASADRCVDGAGTGVVRSVVGGNVDCDCSAHAAVSVAVRTPAATTRE